MTNSIHSANAGTFPLALNAQFQRGRAIDHGHLNGWPFAFMEIKSVCMSGKGIGFKGFKMCLYMDSGVKPTLQMYKNRFKVFIKSMGAQ